ncbi:MAG: hypothetical protein ACM3QU_08440 [Verrucomicrobiota bacterium]
MKRVWVIAVVALVGSSFAAPASSMLRSGLHGRVCRGKLPPAGQAASCAVPQKLVFVLSKPGRRYVVRSAVDGAYRIRAEPGVYRAALAVHVGINVPILRPTLVRVRPNRDDRLNFYLETRSRTAGVDRTSILRR